jgi:hypothetical protein
VLTVPAGVEEVALVSPDGKTTTLPVHGGQAAVKAEDVGLYEVRAGKDRYSFAASALSPETSDLADCAAGRWGGWDNEAVLRTRSQSVAWIFLLGALAVLTAHLALVARGPGRVRP